MRKPSKLVGKAIELKNKYVDLCKETKKLERDIEELKERLKGKPEEDTEELQCSKNITILDISSISPECWDGVTSNVPDPQEFTAESCEGYVAATVLEYELRTP